MPHLDLVDGLVSMMAADLPVAGAVRLVNDFCAGFPDYVATVQSILSMPPANILSTLPMIDPGHATAAGMEHAGRWLSDLQTALSQPATTEPTTPA